jgi:DNA-binding transcriptional regulator YiaG
MPNLAAVLKAEIIRLARRSTRPLYVPIKKDVSALKRALVQQRRALAQLARDNARLVADLNTRLATPSIVSDAEIQHARISPRLIKAQRTRLGLSRDAFAKLVGVTGGAVLAWEGGKSKPRAAAKAALVAIRKLGKREARTRLEVLANTNGNGQRKAPGARGRRKPSRPRRR